jgi:glycosyltransferase 2 family protein
MMKFARYVAALGLLGALFYFRLIDLTELRKAAAHPGLLILAGLLSFATLPVCGARWHMLLRSQGLRLHLWETIRIVMIGAFFGTFLPGSAGGDLVRGVYIYQASQGRRTGALLSIFIDRLIGLTAFVVLGAAATLGRPSASYGTFEYGILAIAALFLIGIATAFVCGHGVAQLLSGFFGGRSRRLAAIIDQAGDALHQYARTWPTVLIAFAISLFLVTVIATATVMVARAMETGELSNLEYGIAGVYAMIANSLPFTPGGIGIGEGAFASACLALEPTSSAIAYGTIFLVLRCVVVSSTLPGLFAYLLYPQRMTLLTSAVAQANP